MRCNRARALLSDYVDGRMPLGETQEIHGHLDACPGCRSEWQELVALKHLLAAARTPRAPADFWAQTGRRLREQARAQSRQPESRSQRWWGYAWKRAPALVAGMAALVTAVLVPLEISMSLRDAPALDTHAAMAQHVAYATYFPLADRRSMDFVVDESRPKVLD